MRIVEDDDRVTAREYLFSVQTMWIQTDNPTQRLKTEALDEAVEFSEQGTAQVSQEVGESLVEQFDAITEKDN